MNVHRILEESCLTSFLFLGVPEQYEEGILLILDPPWRV